MSEMGDYWGRETLIRLEGEPNIVKTVSGIVDDAVAANVPAAKRSNLQSAVIEAAKEYRKREDEMWRCESAEHNSKQRAFEKALDTMDAAIDTLIEFESQQEK